MENIDAMHGRSGACKASQSERASLRSRRDNQPAALPLRLAQEGERVEIVSLNGGRGFHDRLAGLGLHVGVRIEVIQNRMDGKLLVGREGARLFLGGGMAQKIQVVPVGGGDK